jgi:hypothetical protein
VTKISAGSTAFRKRALPAIMAAIVVIGMTLSLSSGGLRVVDPLVFLPPILALAFGFILFKKLVWDLVDEVYDCGDSLLVRNGRVEERVPLSNIMNVSASTMTNPPRVTLRLATPGKFGDEIAFAPIKPISLNLFARNKIADDLIVRVDRARKERKP